MTNLFSGCSGGSSGNAVIVSADTSGIQDALGAFVNAYALAAGSGRELWIPAGNYRLSSNWTPYQSDINIRCLGTVRFNGAFPDFNNLNPYEAVPGPLWSEDLIVRTYGVEYTGQGNIFQRLSCATTNAPNVPVVALYSQGIASGANSRAWGINTSAFANNATAIVIGNELDVGVLVAGGTATGLAIAASGNFPVQAAIQLDANNAASQYTDGYITHYSEVNGRGCITNNVIKITGGNGPYSVAQRFLYANQVRASVAEIDIPGLLVDPTIVGAGSSVGTVNRPRFKGGASGVAPLFLPSGEVNSGNNIAPLGTGVLGLYDGALALKVGINTVGIGLNGKNPVAQVTGFGAPTGASLLVNFPGATATLPQTSGMVAYLLNLLLARGDIGL